MINTLCNHSDALRAHQGFITASHLRDARWIDLLEPTVEEEQHVEHLLGLELPNKDELRVLEESSRLHERDGALYLIALVVVNSESEYPRSDHLAFVLTRERLVTVRYASPKALALFEERARRQPALAASGEDVLLGLVETLLERIALNIDTVGGDLDRLSHEVLNPEPVRRRRRPDHGARLRRLELNQVLLARARASLSSLARLLGYVGRPALGFEFSRAFHKRSDVLQQNVQSLIDHTNFLAGNINFELSAILGMINIEQNAIIRIFSVAAVIFMPPTLVASVYGMNFEWMPELGWPRGYPMALGLMLLSALGTYWFFKRRGWL